MASGTPLVVDRGSSLPISELPQKGKITTSDGERSAQSLSGTSKCASAAFVLGEVAGIVLIALGAANLFGPIGSIGFIASIAGGGLVALISAGGLIWLVIANCKHPKKQETSQDVSTNSLSQDWQQRLNDLESKICYTNVHKYADQCVEQLAQNNVPIDGYEKLMVWEPSRQCPYVFAIDGLAPSLDPKKLPPRSVLLIVVLAENDFLSLKQWVLSQKLSDAKGPDSPVVLHFVKIEKSWRGTLTTHLSPQQCTEISNHRGEDLSIIT